MSQDKGNDPNHYWLGSFPCFRAGATGVVFALEQKLHQSDVEPAIELAPDLTFDANEIEPA